MAKIDTAQLWGLSYRLVSGVITGVAPQLTELGLEAKELFVLAELDDHPHPAALAERLCFPRPTITFYVKRLEKEGFIRRAVDEVDLRRHRLTLTPAGRKVMTRGLAILTEAFGDRLNKLSATDQAEFGALLEKMG